MYQFKIGFNTTATKLIHVFPCHSAQGFHAMKKCKDCFLFMSVLQKLIYNNLNICMLDYKENTSLYDIQIDIHHSTNMSIFTFIISLQ